MTLPESPRSRLDRANIDLAKELMAVKSSLTIYSIIGLNASKIDSSKAFFGHLQRLALQDIALGLGKVFERERRFHLSSLRGVLRLAQDVPIENLSASSTYVRAYGVASTESWATDVEEVFLAQRPLIKTYMARLTHARHTRIAHLQQDAPIRDLPSIAAFEHLLTFAVRFQSFINEAFLNTHSHPILQDGTMRASLTHLLQRTGIADVVSDFSATDLPDPAST
jgi:hypothetical protein